MGLSGLYLLTLTFYTEIVMGQVGLTSSASSFILKL